MFFKQQLLNCMISLKQFLFVVSEGNEAGSIKTQTHSSSNCILQSDSSCWLTHSRKAVREGGRLYQQGTYFKHRPWANYVAKAITDSLNELLSIAPQSSKILA